MMVEVERLDGIAVVTLSDPARRNAIGREMAGGLMEACNEIDADLSVGVAVFRSAGDYFCSGGDRDELAMISDDPLSEPAVEALNRIYDSFLRIGQLKVPSIAVIRGGAIGAGMNLALACDVRVVANDAVLASGFGALGVHPGGGHLGLLARAGNLQLAVGMGVLGQTIRGEEAVRLGFALSSADDDEIEDVAMALAARSAGSPGLTRTMIRSARLEAGPPALSWSACVEVERSAQLKSFAQKGGAGWREQRRQAR